MTRDEAIMTLAPVGGCLEALDLPDLTVEQLRANVEECGHIARTLYDGFLEATERAEVRERVGELLPDEITEETLVLFTDRAEGVRVSSVMSIRQLADCVDALVREVRRLREENELLREAVILPACPWPESAWRLTPDEAAERIGDDALCTAVAGCFYREGWRLAERALREQIEEADRDT